MRREGEDRASEASRLRSNSLGEWTTAGRNLNNIADNWTRRNSLPDMSGVRSRGGHGRGVRSGRESGDRVGVRVVSGIVRIVTAVGIYICMRKIENVLS